MKRRTWPSSPIHGDFSGPLNEPFRLRLPTEEERKADPELRAWKEESSHQQVETWLKKLPLLAARYGITGKLDDAVFRKLTIALATEFVPGFKWTIDKPPLPRGQPKKWGRDEYYALLIFVEIEREMSRSKIADALRELAWLWHEKNPDSGKPDIRHEERTLFADLARMAGKRSIRTEVEASAKSLRKRLSEARKLFAGEPIAETVKRFAAVASGAAVASKH